MPSPRAPDPVQNARLHLLFRQALTASVTALIGAAICAAVFWHAIRSPEPWIWLSGVGLATTLRFLLYRRFFRSGLRQRAESHWLRQHAWTAILIGVSWGALPLLPAGEAAHHLHGIQTLVPAFVLMAAVTSYGVYYSQYLVLLVSTAATTLAARVFVGGPHLLPEAALFALFVPLLAMTAKRYGDSLASSLNDQFRAEGLVAALSSSNAELQRQNDAMARHRHVVD